LAVLYDLDTWLFRVVYDHAPHALLEPCMVFVSAAGGGLGLLYVLPLTWRFGSRRMALALLANVAVTAVIVYLLKFSIGRERPYLALHVPHIGPFLPHDPSCPSGHAAGAFVVAGFVALRPSPNWLKVSVYVAATLVALSRVYLGAHYPSDCLLGAALGTTIAAVSRFGGKSQ
jgi:undecaprenyl-diphosphatase